MRDNAGNKHVAIAVSLPTTTVLAQVPVVNLVVAAVVLPVAVFACLAMPYDQGWMLVVKSIGLLVALHAILSCVIHACISRDILWISKDGELYARSRYFPWIVDSLPLEAIIELETNYEGPHLSINDVILTVDPAKTVAVCRPAFSRYAKNKWRVNLIVSNTNGHAVIEALRNRISIKKRSL